jgi:hypothetical protein
MERKIVNVSVELRSGTARFRVGVQASSIKKALSVVGGRYPHGELRAVFPMDPEGFLVSEPSAPIRVVGPEQAYPDAA